MNETKCTNKECGGGVLMGDQFCGSCGTPVPDQPVPEALTWGTRLDGKGQETFNYGTDIYDAKTMSAANGGVTDSPSVAPGGEPNEMPFFSHEPRRQPALLSNATRFLCAAAYLDYGFANKVILNLMMTRRAVAPSVNFDVGPVLRHCLNARRHIFIRDVVLVLIVLTGLVIKTLPTIDVLLFTFVLGGALPSARHRRSRFQTHLVLLLATVVGGGFVLAFTLFLVLGSVASSVFSGGVSMASVVAGLLSLAVTFAVIVGALSATEFVYLHTTAQALAIGSRQDTKSHRSMSRAAEQRMAVVEGAQWGNITLHNGWFPFIGAGAQTQTHWSAATPLRIGAADNQHGKRAPLDGGYVRIDPVDLHRFIGDRLRALNDPILPENERIAELTVTDRLVGTGWISGGNSLFDTALKTPYSHASRGAVEALIRHPQARLRYYQQVSVNDESPVVMSQGRKVIDDVDQEVAVSAFVYAAVEGRMLYLQFVLTALPPIDAIYRVGRMSYATSVSGTLVYTFKRLFSSIIFAAPGIYGAFRLWREERQWEKWYLSAAEGDYGAQISIRELGTADDFSQYIQVLDVEKYNMMISQVLLDAVTEYLTDKGIDTSAFTGIAQNIINNINNGNINGNLTQQAGNKNTSTNQPQSGLAQKGN